MTLSREILLTVVNAHRSMDGGKAEPPVFDQPFIAYMTNRHGEQMVIAGDAETLTLYHGDCAWRPLPILDSWVPGLNCDANERQWIAAVWRNWWDWR